VTSGCLSGARISTVPFTWWDCPQVVGKLHTWEETVHFKDPLMGWGCGSSGRQRLASKCRALSSNREPPKNLW
jgi:hypothetical protein